MSTPLPEPSQEFAGRRALVTGGSRGIGAAIAQRLLDGGANVVVTARSRHEQTPAGATYIPGDILTAEGCQKIGDEAVKILGRLGRTEDISEMVTFLLSPRASWITGQNIFVNGGLAF